MHENDIAELLIKEGCPSISYRVRKEIRQEQIGEEEYREYQNLIYAQPNVQNILSWQNPDGYFGTRLHTAPTGSKIWPHEGCVRYLLETGLDHEAVRKSLDVMRAPGWGKECENSRAASTIGYEMIRASLFAQAGDSKEPFVASWVNHALQGFRTIAETECYEDLVYEVRKRSENGKKPRSGLLLFQEGKYLPVVYHLRLLAFTDFWRTEENRKMMELAYEKLYQWLPLPPIYYKCRTHPAAPLGTVSWAANQNFQADSGFFWLHFYEMSARMGMLGENSPFRVHFEELKNHVLQQDESFLAYTKSRNRSYTGWSGYSGIALEEDGRAQQPRMRDFMFRILLVNAYCNMGWE